MSKLPSIILCLLLGAAIGGTAMAASSDRAREDLAAGTQAAGERRAEQRRDPLQEGGRRGSRQRRSAVPARHRLVRNPAICPMSRRICMRRRMPVSVPTRSPLRSPICSSGRASTGRILDEIPEGWTRARLEGRIRTARGYAQLNLRQTRDAERAFRQGIALAQTGLAPGADGLRRSRRGPGTFSKGSRQRPEAGRPSTDPARSRPGLAEQAGGGPGRRRPRPGARPGQSRRLARSRRAARRNR